jgi:predicted aldo/keto reductase-like oxidoreductase
MAKITLGSTGITTEQNAFGALPIQRRSREDAVKLLRRAFDGGMTYFDTARAYSDSEEKLGVAFSGRRDKIFIATKTGATTPDGFWSDLETSLRLLRTDYIDVYQFHNPKICFKPDDGTGMYECMLKAKEQGKIRHIGFTNHLLANAHACIDSGLYETLQFPFSYLASEKEIELVEKCKAANMGFVAMKGLAGGLIHNSAAAFAYVALYPNVLPIWGIQHSYELEEFLRYFDNPPAMTPELEQVIAHDREELVGDFCRGCGYCMPCTVGIQINNCARISLMLRRAPSAGWLSDEWQAEMKKIENCVDCGLCKSRCPYGLDTPALLRKNYEDYQRVLSGQTSVD